MATFQTGDPVPSNGKYQAEDGCRTPSGTKATKQLVQGNQFPPCPICQLATAWTPAV